jgi:hypothetical protein
MESTAQRNLMHCGVGIGKSHVIGALAIEFCIHNPEVRGFIGANTYSQLSKSTLDRVFKVWQEQFTLEKGIHYVVDHIPPDNFKIIGPRLKSYENTICFNNGAMIFTASLDNYRVIDGTEFGWAMLDETKDTKEEAVKEVIVARLRQVGMYISPSGVISKTMKAGYTGYNPLFVFTSPAKVKWLMKWFELDKYVKEIESTIYRNDDYFRKRTGDKLVIIASTYHNQENLSPGYIERLINDLSGNQNLINMQIYGSPFAKMGGEYYHAFSRINIVKKFDPWNEFPVHLSFDFNLVPYITCTCWQIKEYFCEQRKETRYLVRCFREFCLPNPKNNAESLCKELKIEIEPLLKNGIFYYGDYSGKTNDTVNEQIRNEFERIEFELEKYIQSNYSNRVIVNPLHLRRRAFMNKIFSGQLPIDIEIHENCIETIADFEFIKESSTGGKSKDKITVNGKSFEEHGHTSDSADYLFCSAFENFFTL